MWRYRPPNDTVVRVGFFAEARAWALGPPPDKDDRYNVAHLAIFAPAVVYGRPTTSHAPLASVMRSPIRSCVGKMRRVLGGRGGGIPGSCGWTGLVPDLAFGRFFSGRGLGTG